VPEKTTLWFLADMGISLRIVSWLKGRGHDVTHLRDEGLQRLPDREIFKKAAAEKRIILTFDLDFGEIVALSQDSPVSVFLFRLHNTTTSFVIKRLEQVLSVSADFVKLHTAIIVIDDSRHRIRTIPIG
jgi:predicted nuclease of predicted toxin-antitoxin system